MSLALFLRRVVATLDASDVSCMLTGSLAAAYYSVPRATQDIDLVVEGTSSAFEKAAASFVDQGLYASPDAAMEAVRTQGQFNVIDPESGWKADLILRRDRSFQQERVCASPAVNRPRHRAGAGNGSIINKGRKGNSRATLTAAPL